MEDGGLSKPLAEKRALAFFEMEIRLKCLSALPLRYSSIFCAK